MLRASLLIGITWVAVVPAHPQSGADIRNVAGKDEEQLQDGSSGRIMEFALSPEPHAYETDFAVKWTIADQIQGKPGLNLDPVKGAVRAPWIAWGRTPGPTE
jgi:hypothetical protein